MLGIISETSGGAFPVYNRLDVYEIYRSIFHLLATKHGDLGILSTSGIDHLVLSVHHRS